MVWLMMYMPKPPSSVPSNFGGRTAGIEALTEVMQPQHDAVLVDLRRELNPSIGPPAVGVPHHVARGFGHRQFELVDGVLVDRTGEPRAHITDERPRPRSAREIARDFHLRAHLRQLALLDSHRHTGEVVAKPLGARERDRLQTNPFDEVPGLEMTIAPKAVRQPFDAEQLPRAFRVSVSPSE